MIRLFLLAATGIVVYHLLTQADAIGPRGLGAGAGVGKGTPQHLEQIVQRSGSDIGSLFASGAAYVENAVSKLTDPSRGSSDPAETTPLRAKPAWRSFMDDFFGNNLSNSKRRTPKSVKPDQPALFSEKRGPMFPELSEE